MYAFNELYEQKLKPRLIRLEAMRIKVRLKFILLWAAFIMAFAGLFYVVKSASKSDDWLSMLSLLTLIAVVVVYYRDKSEDRYNAAYDKLIVDEIIGHVGPDWETRKRHNQVKEFWGEHNGLPFYCADARTGHIRVSSLGVFGRGFFFRAEHGKNLSTKTFIFPDKAEKKVGRSARSVQRRTTGLKNDFKKLGKLIELENPAFEKEFMVYGTRPIEARYILNPVIMESIMNLHSLINRPLYFVYTKKYVYCHFSYWQFSKPPVYRSVINKKRMEMILQIVAYCKVIIRELKLELNPDLLE
jgi:hypothetical protein